MSTRGSAPADPPRNASTAMATVLIDELIRGGVREFVLAPGSRSAALAFAADAAAAAGKARLHTRIDERSAAFLALGLAKTSHRPVAVISTSGTAVANLHPAVLEASHTGVPLVVLTADRPARLRGTNANQTTDQVKIFGGSVRESADVPAAHPGSDSEERRQVVAWRSLVARAVARSRGGVTDRPGPVHLNVQFEEPVTPDPDDGWTNATDGRGSGQPWMRSGDRAVAPPEPLNRGPRTVVVAGDDAGPPARILAQNGRWPLLAEPTSGSRTGDNVIRTYRLLLADEALAGQVERVVLFGHPTLSRPVGRLLAGADIEIIAVTGPSGWTDAGQHVHRVVHEAQVQGEPADGSANEAWLDLWRSRDDEVSKALDTLLDLQADLTPQHVAGAVSAAVPPNGLLFVGASNPVRDLDLMVAPYPVGDRRMVIGNRGLAGIDGSVSTAVGAALGRPHTSRAFALLGDVTFLHDTNGLLVGPGEARPDLMVVVVNDDGGSIFASLEQGGSTYSGSYDKLFGTPHHADLAALCAATRTPHRKVTSRDGLRSAIESPVGGIEVVEAVVRRDNRRDLDATIRGLVLPQD